MAEPTHPDKLPDSLDRATLAALVQASRAINSELEMPQVFRRVVEQAAVVLHAEGASVLLLDEDREELVFMAATGPAGGSLEGERIRADQGIAGQIVRTTRPVRIDDVRQNRNFYAGIDAKTQGKTQALIGAPMLFRGKILGVVEVLNPLGKKRSFTDDDIELLKVFANLAAITASRAQAFDNVSKTARGLRGSMPAPLIVGQSKGIKKVLELCERVGPTRATVLVTGETGAGKELVARSIHELSDRRDKPFIALNCAALTESLLDSELFGHEKGAFTGASEQKLGRFELADGGTLFLDELGEMNHATQVKLLRVLQEHEFVRVGGTRTLTCDVRIVAATNRDLKAEAESNRFRSDLFYRLSVFPIELPPLRQRIDDLPLLVDHFVKQVVPSLGVDPPSVDDAALNAMMRYGWPGNIRELRNVIERSTLLATEGVITVDHLPAEIVASPGGSSTGTAGGAGDGSPSQLAEHERALVERALVENNWNQTAAARQLGVSRDNLRYRVKKYGLKKPG